MKITFLGTGNAQATACYNTCFVMEEAGRCLLVDGGGGNLLLRRLQAAGYKLAEIAYSNENQAGAPAGGNDDGPIEADYEVVDDKE